MTQPNEYEKRAQAVADTLRNFLIAVNTGGIGVVLAVAGGLIEEEINPKWAFWPIILFICGLGIIGVSLLLAKHREVKRSEADKKGDIEPDFSSLWWRSQTWDTVSLLLFLAGSVLTLIKLSCLSADL